MVKEKRGLLNAGIFLIIGVLLFLLVQKVLSPEWRYPQFNDGVEDTVNEFLTLPEDSVQALFFGASHVADSVDPMRIYERTGVVAYNLGTARQPIEASAGLLKAALKTQQPKVVFFDVSALYSTGFTDSGFRYVLDLLPFGDAKISLAKAYSRYFDEDKRGSAFLSAFLPIISYHDRWEQLKKLDFDLLSKRELYRKGLFLYTPYTSSTIDLDTMNSRQESLAHDTVSVTKIVNGVTSTEEKTEPIYAPEINDDRLNVLLELEQLCDDNGVELILIKIPCIYDPVNHSEWTLMDSAMAKELAQDHGLTFLDLLYDYDIGIDWKYDTPDRGQHLNYSGAKKVSDFFADYLKNECGVQTVVCDEYERDKPIYDAMCKLSELQSTRDMLSFLEAVKWENTTVFFSASDDMKQSLSEEAIAALHQCGLLTDFGQLGYRDAFVGVVENGVSVYEATSNNKLSYSAALSNGCRYSLVSAGWLVGSKSSIKINGTEYSQGSRGVNIVIYDNEYGLVLDSASFDTWAYDIPPAVRKNSLTAEYLRKYEERMMALAANGELAAEA